MAAFQWLLATSQNLIDPLVPRMLRPHVLEIPQPVRRMLHPIDPTEQPLVKPIQCEEVVDRPELTVVLRKFSRSALVRDPPLSALRDQLDRTDPVGQGDDQRIVAIPNQSDNLPVLVFEERVGGGLPGADRLVGDLDLVEDRAPPLLADGRDQAPLNRLLAQAGEGPLGVGGPRRLRARSTNAWRYSTVYFGGRPGPHLGGSIAIPCSLKAQITPRM